MDLTDKCFVIMPISNQGSYEKNHFTKVYEQIIIPAVKEAGYIPYRVDENNICDSIICKIFRAIQECPMAICDLSNRNPNVLYELGLRQAYDKPVVLIQDDLTERIFDVSGINTVFYRSGRLYEDVIEARDNIKKAIIATKKGDIHSVIQIVKASAASISEDNLSKNDRTEILLQQLFSLLNDIKINSYTSVGQKSDSCCPKIVFEYKRPAKGVDEMVEIAKWAREKFHPYVTIDFDELSVNIEIVECELNRINAIMDEIRRVLGV